MTPREQWIDSLKLPDGHFKRYLGDILQPLKESTFHMLNYPYIHPDCTPCPPLRLKDTHLSEKFILKHVRHVKSLLEDLQSEFRLQLQVYLDANGIPGNDHENLPLQGKYSGRVQSIDDVSSIYTNRIGGLALQYSAHMHILPNSRIWVAPLYFFSNDGRESFISELVVAPFIDVQELPSSDSGLEAEHLESLDPSTSMKLEYCCREGFGIALFTFYPPNRIGESIIEQCIAPDFQYTIPRASPNTVAAFDDNIPISLDLEESFWTKYAERAPSVQKAAKLQAHQAKTVWIPGSVGQRRNSEQYTPIVSHFIQRAWNDAVNDDATFILLSCGTKERIGIRHRATNTLFLSDIIVPSDEMYALTQLAFYSAFIHDFMAREPRAPLTAKITPNHSDAMDKPPQAKKPKLNPRNKASRTFDEEMALRPVVLLSYNLGVYRSCAPSTFMRKRASCVPLPVSEDFPQQKGGRRCQITKCIYFQIQDLVGFGLEGLIYRGTATLHQESGSPLEERVIIKVAKPQNAAYGLDNEYKAYWKMATAGVSSGILKVYGLFEDAEMGTTKILMMQDGGTTLLTREQKRLNTYELPNQYRISDSEYNSLKTTIQAINSAGVLHFDIKPNNITVDAQGEIYLIDFGKAQLCSPKGMGIDTRKDDPFWTWSNIDTDRLKAVEDSLSTLQGIRTYDLQTIEDIYIGRFDKNRRY